LTALPKPKRLIKQKKGANYVSPQAHVEERKGRDQGGVGRLV
jgi:integrase